jgi:GntR family transcriptional repressor for pyruvate dehydrogenase complex
MRGLIAACSVQREKTIRSVETFNLTSECQAGGHHGFRLTLGGLSDNLAVAVCLRNAFLDTHGRKAAMPVLRRAKIRDQAAEQIKQYIVTEKLSPGDRLPTETQFAAALGVSRLSIREATKALEFLGIVNSKTGVGLTVGEFDLARVTQHLGFHPSLNRTDPSQLIDTRVIVETGVLPHVMQHMTADRSIRERLQTIVDQSRSASELKVWIELDIAFHHTLLNASGLMPLVTFGELLHRFFQRFRESVQRAEWKLGIDSHQRIIDWLAEGELREAVRELRQHIESHKERLA